MGITETTPLDKWSDYCAKSSELERLILDSYTFPFTIGVREKIVAKRAELERILDDMIGGAYCTEVTNIGMEKSAKDA